ncbi:MAG TPA: hypothetical protein VN541_04075 [Tepidisphaeraceae bacterium]|nr:hypothetical protein [Tepidisphaeraceae bacterium]
MRRRLFTIASASSLVLCAATAVLWVWSYRQPLQWEWTSTKGIDDPAWRSGELCVGLGRVGYITREPTSRSRTRFIKPFHRFSKPMPVQFVYAHPTQFNPWKIGSSSLQVAGKVQDGNVWCCGLQYSRLADLMAGSILRQVWLPFWLVSVLFCCLPLIRATVWLRERHRMRSTLCRACAYDLTGNTSGMCPECGTAITGASHGAYDSISMPREGERAKPLKP